MTPQGLQIASPNDSLTRLGIVTYSVVIVNIVFRVSIANCRRMPVRIQGFTNSFILYGLGLLQLSVLFLSFLRRRSRHEFRHGAFFSPQKVF